MQTKEIELKLAFADIIRGWTKLKSNILGEGSFYIKHLNIFDNVQTDQIYDECYERAKEKKLPTRKDQIEYLIKESLWTEGDNTELEKTRLYVDNLKVTKSKLYLKSQIDSIKESIEEAETKLAKMQMERETLIGFTAEKYAQKKSNEIYIQKAIYSNNDFSELAMTEEEFNYVTDKSLSELTMDYNDATRIVTMENIKKISLMPFFCNYFYLCDDNPHIFYGKPVVDLTFYQAEMFAFGRYFKNLAQDAKVQPPDEIRNDPDKLIEFYEAKKNADAVMDKANERAGDKGGATSLVGATKEDLEALGYQQGQGTTVSLTDVANKKGGSLSMEDFIQLHE